MINWIKNKFKFLKKNSEDTSEKKVVSDNFDIEEPTTVDPQYEQIQKQEEENKPLPPPPIPPKPKNPEDTPKLPLKRRGMAKQKKSYK